MMKNDGAFPLKCRQWTEFVKKGRPGRPARKKDTVWGRHEHPDAIVYTTISSVRYMIKFSVASFLVGLSLDHQPPDNQEMSY